MSKNKPIFKSKKILATLTKRQRNNFVFMSEEARLFYNDVIHLYKLLYYFSNFQQMLKELENTAKASGSNRLDIDDLILNEIDFENIWDESAKDLILKLRTSNWSYISLSYLIPKHKRRFNYINSGTKAELIKDIAGNIATTQTVWKQYMAGKAKDKPGELRYVKRYELKCVPFKPNRKFKFDKDTNHVYLPKLRGGIDFGKIKFKDSGDYFNPDMDVKTIKLIQEGDRYFLCFTVKEQQDLTNLNIVKESIGVDWGVVNLATLSNGERIKPVDEFHKKIKFLEKKKTSLQRQLASRIKFGKNWKKTKKELAKVERRITFIRDTHLEQVTAKLSNYERVFVEDLKIRNMTASAKGTEEEPGKMVKQKAGLNRSILRNSPYKFLTRLEEKCNNKDNIFLKVTAKNTSRECFACGFTDKDNRTTQEEFECKKCGHKENADVNAAKNIRKRGLEKI